MQSSYQGAAAGEADAPLLLFSNKYDIGME